MRRSSIKATLAMYPESSNRVIKKTRIMIWGRNMRIAPTPPMIPSTVKSRSIPAGRETKTHSPRMAMPCVIQSIGTVAQVKIDWNIIVRSPIKITGPRKG